MDRIQSMLSRYLDEKEEMDGNYPCRCWRTFRAWRLGMFIGWEKQPRVREMEKLEVRKQGP